MKELSIFRKNKRSKDDDDNEHFDFRDIGVRMYNETEVLNDVDAYIDEPILAPGHYRNLFQYMRRMKEYDKLKIWLHSPGGYAETTMEFIEAMQQAKGEITVVVSGFCASAATMIALAAPQLQIQQNASMMFHAGSFGAAGKMDEVYSRVVFSHEQMKKMLWYCYEGFFTQEEFDALIAGKDYYMTSEEINRRLELRSEWQRLNDKIEKNNFTEN